MTAEVGPLSSRQSLWPEPGLRVGFVNRVAALLMLATLGGCRLWGGDDVATTEKARREAQIACLARAKDIFPQAFSWEIQLQAMDRNDGSPMPGDFRTAGGGDFNWTFTTAETQRMLPAKVECVGNMDRRQVGGITYDGTVRRPPDGVVWSY